jgi:hypothetical protein
MTEPVSETPAANSDAPQIGVVDLQNALRIIDASAERGTFKGNELSAVGVTRDRIAAFLASLPEAQKQ